MWIEVWILFSFRAEAVSLEPNSVNYEATNDARPKEVRKAEATETATAEPLTFPETKMRRVDGAPLVESEAETIADSAGLESGVIKSRAIRSDEARARKNAKHSQRQSTEDTCQ